VSFRNANALTARINRSSVQSTRRTMATVSASSLHNLSIGGLGKGTRDAPVAGDEINFSAFKGKVVLIQNVATI